MYKEGEYDALHVCQGMAYRLREEHISSDTTALHTRYLRAVQIGDTRAALSLGDAYMASLRNDTQRALEALRASKK